MVYNVALGYVQNEQDAEEVTQDVFVEAHRGLPQFKGDSSVKTWLYRIAVHQSLDFLKYKRRKKRFAVLTGLFSKTTNQPIIDPPDFVHPGVLMENKENAALLFKAIDQLPPNQKTAFLLSKVEGLGNVEISQIMGNTVGAVESLQSRAKDNLRKILSTNEGK